MRRVIPPLLREREFGRFWWAQTASLVGDQITLLALPLTAVLVLDAGAAQMGYLTAAELVPNLLFSLHAGALVDRMGRRRATMIVADLGRAALILTIPVAYAFDALTLAQLYIVAFATGTLSVVFQVSFGSLFAAVVSREDYVTGSSLLHGTRAFSYVAGPSAAGFLVQLFRAPFALVVDAFSFVASALLLGTMKVAEPPADAPAPGHFSAGMRWIWRTPVMRASLLSTTTINFFNFVFFALFVLYATRSLEVGPGTLGLVLGAGAVGGLIGSFVAGRIGRRIGIGPAFMLGCVLFPAPLLLVPLAGGPRPLVLLMLGAAEFGSGFGVMLLDISTGAIRAAITPDRLRARVSGAYQVVNYGVRPVGALAGGALGSTIGLRPTLWIATVGALAGVLWLLASPLPGLRDLPEEADYPDGVVEAGEDVVGGGGFKAPSV
ncbi:MAG: MFS transporter [Actinomycetota bacterium]|nr:MFS transporter [Actinomycetota bacterium]